MTNNKTNTKLKPFNLELALAGHPVITSDGQVVSQIVEFNVKHGKYSIAGIINGEIRTFMSDGSFYNCSSESCINLFMAPIKKQGWVNVFKDDSDSYYTAGDSIHGTENDALNSGWVNHCDYLGTTMIEWEE